MMLMTTLRNLCGLLATGDPPAAVADPAAETPPATAALLWVPPAPPPPPAASRTPDFWGVASGVADRVARSMGRTPSAPRPQPGPVQFHGGRAAVTLHAPEDDGRPGRVAVLVGDSGEALAGMATDPKVRAYCEVAAKYRVMTADAAARLSRAAEAVKGLEDERAGIEDAEHFSAESLPRLMELDGLLFRARAELADAQAGATSAGALRGLVEKARTAAMQAITTATSDAARDRLAAVERRRAAAVERLVQAVSPCLSELLDYTTAADQIRPASDSEAEAWLRAEAGEPSRDATVYVGGLPVYPGQSVTL